MATKNNSSSSSSTRTCLCSPTTHPGSFKCSLHRNSKGIYAKSKAHMNQMEVSASSSSSSSSRTAAAKSKNIVMMASKANLIKAFLMQIIKPSSHSLQRRRNFKPKLTRFCPLNGKGHHGVTVS
ncbi:hypothetical protein P3X46_010813 [Hevea brasiliensis]|uniref:Serine-rich protein-like protein n=1 Tax=Hevea brasiliensis TaxID=3981 RepID=A0ABQ9MHN9_HEVBR|nr:uncharacterized protein LOC131180678 [Hevea brasiliensis]KAJ9178977.1 hypothetical protein P3X46_010813 [Hevea brasiliensis]